jgi:hypothetical protein
MIDCLFEKILVAHIQALVFSARRELFDRNVC